MSSLFNYLIWNSVIAHDAVPWWEQEADSGHIGQSKSWKTCRMCPVSGLKILFDYNFVSTDGWFA